MRTPPVPVNGHHHCLVTDFDEFGEEKSSGTGGEGINHRGQGTPVRMVTGVVKDTPRQTRWGPRGPTYKWKHREVVGTSLVGRAPSVVLKEEQGSKVGVIRSGVC